GPSLFVAALRWFVPPATATAGLYTLSLHDALPIFPVLVERFGVRRGSGGSGVHKGGDGAVRRIRFREPMMAAMLANRRATAPFGDRKSTRLNSSHVKISYAVFCLKKKKKPRDEDDG